MVFELLYNENIPLIQKLFVVIVYRFEFLQVEQFHQVVFIDKEHP
jgi:hypothetical protein